MSDRFLIDAKSQGRRLSGHEFAVSMSVPVEQCSVAAFSRSPRVRAYLLMLAEMDPCLKKCRIERIFDKPSAQWWA